MLVNQSVIQVCIVSLSQYIFFTLHISTILPKNESGLPPQMLHRRFKVGSRLPKQHIPWDYSGFIQRSGGDNPGSVNVPMDKNPTHVGRDRLPAN